MAAMSGGGQRAAIALMKHRSGVGAATALGPGHGVCVCFGG